MSWLLGLVLTLAPEAGAQESADTANRDLLEAQFAVCQEQVPPIDFETMTARSSSIPRWQSVRFSILDSYPEDGGSYNWPDVESVRESHVRLWQRAEIAFPEVGPGILIFLQSSHWATVHRSIVVQRLQAGQWQLSWVNALNAETEREYFVSGTNILSQANSEALDILLADPCLIAEPTRSEWATFWSSANWHWNMEFVGMAGNRIASGADSGFGRNGLALELILRTPD